MRHPARQLVSLLLAAAALSPAVARANDLEVDGAIEASGPLVSTATSGPPIVVQSSQLVPNLNADKLDGLDASAFGTSAEHTQILLLLDAALQALDALSSRHSREDFSRSGDENGNGLAISTPGDLIQPVRLVVFDAQHACDTPARIDVDWGDGQTSSSTNAITKGNNFAFDHTYANPGTYTIKVTLWVQNGTGWVLKTLLPDVTTIQVQ